MPAVLTDKLKVGMKLCQALHTDKGKVYLPAGTILDEKLLAELSRARYKYVRVDSSSLSQKKPAPPASDFEDRLEERFSRVALCPFLRLIKEALKAAMTTGSQG